MLSAGVILTVHHTSFFLVSIFFPWDFSSKLQLEFNSSSAQQEILNTEDKILNLFQLTESWNLSYSVLSLLTRAGFTPWT